MLAQFDSIIAQADSPDDVPGPKVDDVAWEHKGIYWSMRDIGFPHEAAMQLTRAAVVAAIMAGGVRPPDGKTEN